MITFANLPDSDTFKSTGIAQHVFVPGAAAPELRELLRDHTSWVTLPPAPTAVASRLPVLLHEIRNVTGWSQRDLAEILHTSHTTVRRLETDGRVTARSRTSAARITPLHGVLTRLVRVAGNPQTLATALLTDDGRGKATDFLRAGQWSRAFTVALDVLNGPPPTMLAPKPDWALRQPATREIRH